MSKPVPSHLKQRDLEYLPLRDPEGRFPQEDENEYGRVSHSAIAYGLARFFAKLHGRALTTASWLHVNVGRDRHACRVLAKLNTTRKQRKQYRYLVDLTRRHHDWKLYQRILASQKVSGREVSSGSSPGTEASGQES